MTATVTAAAAEQLAHMNRKHDQRNWSGRDGRTVETRWELRKNADGSTEYATLYVSHWGNPHYCYRATLNRTTMGTPSAGGLVGELSSPMDGVVVVKSPQAKRYSRKAHLAFLEVAYAAVADPANADRLAKYFNPDYRPAGSI